MTNEHDSASTVQRACVHKAKLWISKPLRIGNSAQNETSRLSWWGLCAWLVAVGLKKGNAVNVGGLSGSQEAKSPPTGVRAAIVASKSGNADGAKGGRKADASHDSTCESRPSEPSYKFLKWINKREKLHGTRSEKIWVSP